MNCTSCFTVIGKMIITKSGFTITWSYQMLDRRFAYFLAVLDHGTYRAASAALGISQPAITKAINSLESEFELKLLDRLPNGIKPTEAGIVLERRARAMLLEASYAKSDLKVLSAGSRSFLRIGAGPLWEAAHLAPVLLRLQKSDPRLRIKVEIGLAAEVTALLQKGNVDLCLGSMDYIPTESREFLEMETLGSYNLVCFVRADHPLFELDETTWADKLPTWPWAFYRADSLRAREINSTFRLRGIMPANFMVETNSMLLAFNMARSSDLIICIADGYRLDAERHGLREVKQPASRSYRIGAWWLRSTGLNIAAARFLQFLQDSPGLSRSKA